MDGWRGEEDWTEEWRCTVSGYKHTKTVNSQGRTISHHDNPVLFMLPPSFFPLGIHHSLPPPLLPSTSSFPTRPLP